VEVWIPGRRTREKHNRVGLGVLLEVHLPHWEESLHHCWRSWKLSYTETLMGFYILSLPRNSGQSGAHVVFKGLECNEPMLGVFCVDLISILGRFAIPTYLFFYLSSFAVEVKTNLRCTMIFLKLTLRPRLVHRKELKGNERKSIPFSFHRKGKLKFSLTFHSSVWQH
jgi:hypothetical protein